MPGKIALSTEQFAAAEPTLNVVVQANAGTGKTFVLVQRLLRILFREFQGKQPNALPSGILCLTYTNAGAAEMRNRVLAAVLEWARADDDELGGLLTGIAHNNPPTARDLADARKIFYDFIDSPHTLKIQTIHSFCEDILRRFSLEANVPPSWRLVSGSEQKRLLKDAFAELMNNAPSKTVADAFDNILGQASEYSLEGLLESILGQYRRIFLLQQHANFPDYIIEKTKDFLELKNVPALPDFDGDKDKILTKEGAIRKKLPPELQAVAEQVYKYDQYEKNAEIMRTSTDFLTLSCAFADKYVGLKNRRGLLDFDDMLIRTMLLFKNPESMGHVLSQLDMNMKHILVDESQDNSPIMWDIIFGLLDDFFDDGEKENPRSLFIVGDIKQSIFSFQGANPSEFQSIPKKIGGIAEKKSRQYATVNLSESRRTTQAILDVVDFFFNETKTRGFPEDIHHKCWRTNDAGLVEIHPLYEKISGDELAATRKKYIKTIADKIESLVKKEGIPENDIMILVQRREPFAAHLAHELKRKNIAAAGSDRIVLSEFPAIRDLLNLIRFVVDPGDRENDAALAFVLRGPICRWTEKELYDLSAGRDLTKPLFETLREKNPAVHTELLEIAGMAAYPPYSFLSEIMNRYRAKFIAAFGRPAIEPLDEFMTLALSYERTQPGGLQGFLRWFLDGENEIRRDMEKGAGVRILTAHSSKGLEAPVVFLIDTTKNPQSQKKSRPFSVLAPNDDVFLCKSDGIKTERVAAAKEIEQAREWDEYWRLFYVAMTRARDRLYVYGCEEKSKNQSWHSELYKTIQKMQVATISKDGMITVSTPGTSPIKQNEKLAENVEKNTLTTYDNILNNQIIIPRKIRIPRWPFSEMIPTIQNKQAMRHGTDIHKKLQNLNLSDKDEMVEKIRLNPDIAKFWNDGAMVEVPIAGTIDGEFFSLRIDRMIETDDSVMFLDYKTDTARDRHDEYVAKMKKYAVLLSRIYPGKKIMAHILWLHDWELEKIEQE